MRIWLRVCVYVCVCDCMHVCASGRTRNGVMVVLMVAKENVPLFSSHFNTHIYIYHIHTHTHTDTLTVLGAGTTKALVPTRPARKAKAVFIFY
jgi:hypothetical protein